MAPSGSRGRADATAGADVHSGKTERPVLPAISAPPASPTRAVAVAMGRIEIELGDGSRVRVDDGVSLATLRRVISALRG